MWLRLAVDVQGAKPQVLDGIKPPIDLATDLTGWACIDFIDTQPWTGCANSAIPGNCFVPTTPYHFAISGLPGPEMGE